MDGMMVRFRSRPHSLVDGDGSDGYVSDLGGILVRCWGRIVADLDLRSMYVLVVACLFVGMGWGRNMYSRCRCMYYVACYKLEKDCQW